MKCFVEHIVGHTYPPVRAQRIVVRGPGRFDVVELVEAEADKVVQTFPFMGFDPRFRERIRTGRLERYSDTSHALRFPEGLELVRELAVTVMNQKARFNADVIKPHGRVARLLHDPIPIRMIRGRAAIDLAAAQVNEDKHIGRENASKGVNTFSEEIGCDHRVHVSMNKSRPRNRRFLEGLIRRRVNVGILENVPHRCLANPNPQLLKLADDLAISPTQVLFSHTENKVHSRHRSARLAGRFEGDATPGLAHPLAIGIRADHMHDFGNVMAKQRTKSKEFCFLLRSWYNTTRIDPRPQNSNLRRHELESGVISRPKPLQSQSQYRENETIHTISFCNTKPA